MKRRPVKRKPTRGAEVVSLATARDAAAREHALVLADVAGVQPEQGQRTPQPKITRWDRSRFGDLQLESVTGILRRAEDGETEALADLWLRMLKTDGHLHSVWETRIAPVYSARWEVTAPDTSPEWAPHAARLADACLEATAALPDLPGLLSALLDARGLGYAVAEILWSRGRLFGQSAWLPGTIKPVHSRRFRFDDHFTIGLYDDGTAIQRLRADGWPVTELRSRGAALAALPAGKYIVHQPIGIHDYPTATGLVHPCARWWWVKQTAMKLWLAGAEVAANPRIIGKVLQEAVGDSVVEDLLEGLETLAADGIMVARQGTEVTIVDSKARGSAEVWQMLLTRMDLAMSKVVLGSTLNVEVGASGGNRALGESQDEVTIRPRQQQDAAQLWTTIQRDVWRWIRDYNPHLFPAGTPLPRGRSVLVEDRVTIDQLAVDSGAVTVDEVRQSRGLLPLGGELGSRFVAPVTRSAAEATLPSTDGASGPSAPSQGPFR